MSQALDEMFHSYVPANSPSQLQGKRLRWFSPESQGPSRASPNPTCAPSQYLSPVQDLWDLLLWASPLSRAWAVPRMCIPAVDRTRLLPWLELYPSSQQPPRSCCRRVTAHGALHEPAQWSWILGPGAGSASGAPLKSIELRSCEQSCSSALGKLCNLQPGEQPFLHGALPIFL